MKTNKKSKLKIIVFLTLAISGMTCAASFQAMQPNASFGQVEVDAEVAAWNAEVDASVKQRILTECNYTANIKRLVETITQTRNIDKYIETAKQNLQIEINRAVKNVLNQYMGNIASQLPKVDILKPDLIEFPVVIRITDSDIRVMISDYNEIVNGFPKTLTTLSNELTNETTIEQFIALIDAKIANLEALDDIQTKIQDKLSFNDMEGNWDEDVVEKINLAISSNNILLETLKSKRSLLQTIGNDISSLQTWADMQEAAITAKAEAILEALVATQTIEDFATKRESVQKAADLQAALNVLEKQYNINFTTKTAAIQQKITDFCND